MDLYVWTSSHIIWNLCWFLHSLAFLSWCFCFCPHLRLFKTICFYLLISLMFLYAKYFLPFLLNIFLLLCILQLIHCSVAFSFLVFTLDRVRLIWFLRYCILLHYDFFGKIISHLRFISHFGRGIIISENFKIFISTFLILDIFETFLLLAVLMII